MANITIANPTPEQFERIMSFLENERDRIEATECERIATIANCVAAVIERIDRAAEAQVEVSHAPTEPPVTSTSDIPDANRFARCNCGVNESAPVALHALTCPVHP